MYGVPPERAQDAGSHCRKESTPEDWIRGKEPGGLGFKPENRTIARPFDNHE